MSTPQLPVPWPTDELRAALLCADLSLGLYEYLLPTDGRLRPVLELVGPALTTSGAPKTARSTFITALETVTECAATAENETAVVATDAFISLVRAAMALHDHQPYGRSRMRSIVMVLEAIADVLGTGEDDVAALRQAAARMPMAIEKAIIADLAGRHVREREIRGVWSPWLYLLRDVTGRHTRERKADHSTISYQAAMACYGAAGAVALAIEEASSAATCRAMVRTLRARSPWILDDTASR